MKNFKHYFDKSPARTIGVLLRHAEKEIVSENIFGNDVGLTRQGIENCLTLHSGLNISSLYIESSPVKRCVETASLISSGIHSSPVTTNVLLGNPGFMIKDCALTEKYFIQYSPIEIVQFLLSPDPNPPGFCLSTSIAIENLINIMPQTHALNLFVTHDIILATVLGHFFPETSLEELWPDYLEGLYFWKNKKKLILQYRNLFATT